MQQFDWIDQAVFVQRHSDVIRIIDNEYIPFLFGVIYSDDFGKKTKT